jgi:hypothetical protein
VVYTGHLLELTAGVVKISGLRKTEYVSRLQERENAYRILWGNLLKNIHLGVHEGDSWMSWGWKMLR